MTAPAASSSPLRHLGLLYDAPTDLVDVAAPRLRAAVREGVAVAAILDPPTTLRLADALGGEVAGVSFQAAEELDAPLGTSIGRRVRALGAERPAVVLTQYSALDAPADDLSGSEDAINVMLADRALTMVCACARTAPRTQLDTVHRSHPRLVLAGREGESDNPAFRAPDDHSPTPSPTWGGRHALRIRFAGSADLRRIRAHVGEVADAAGLRGADWREAVLAVHEASVLACDEAESVAAVLGAKDRALCVLDVWTAGRHLVAEAAGPRGVGGVDGAAGAWGVDGAAGAWGVDGAGRLPRDRTRAAGPLQYIREFCREVAVRDSGVTRVVRVVVGG